MELKKYFDLPKIFSLLLAHVKEDLQFQNYTNLQEKKKMCEM